MKLEFAQITLRHFAHIGGPLTLQLRRGDASYFVFGDNENEPALDSNGCGKSTLFVDALCWLLFAETSDGRRKPDLVPWQNGGSPQVIATVWTDDEQHVITRATDPNRLLWDGRAIAQDELQKRLRLNYDTFVHTVVLAGKRHPLFLDLPPGQKLALFSAALELERWDARVKATRLRVTFLASEIEEENGRLDGLLRQLQQLQALYDSTKTRADNWEQEQLNAAAGFELELRQLRERQTRLQREHDAANLAYDGAGTELEPLRREITQLETYLSHSRTQFNMAEALLLTARATVEELEQALRNKRCPTCQQALHTAEHRRELRQQLESAQERNNDGPMRVAKQLVHDQEDQLRRARQAEERFRRQHDAAYHKLDYLTPQLAECKATVKRLTEQQRAARATRNPLREQLDELRRSCDQLNAEHRQRNTEQISRLEHFKRVESWVKGFADVKLYIIEDVLQQLALASDVALQQLGLIDWQLSYQVERETQRGGVSRGLIALVKSPFNPRWVRWECWSGGEQQRLRLAGSLALSEVLLNRAGVEPTLEVLDEPTHGLSRRGIDDLTAFLAERAENLGKSIYLIDQRPTGGRFAATLTVRRTAETIIVDES